MSHAVIAPDTPAGPSVRGAARVGSDQRGSHRRRHSLRPLAVALVAYLGVSILLWWQIWSSHPTTVTTCGCGDASLFVWYLEWPAYALVHGHSFLYSSALFHPTGTNLLSNTSVLAMGVPLIPVTLLWGPVATLNVAFDLGTCALGPRHVLAVAPVGALVARRLRGRSRLRVLPVCLREPRRRPPDVGLPGVAAPHGGVPRRAPPPSASWPLPRRWDAGPARRRPVLRGHRDARDRRPVGARGTGPARRLRIGGGSGRRRPARSPRAARRCHGGRRRHRPPRISGVVRLSRACAPVGIDLADTPSRRRRRHVLQYLGPALSDRPLSWDAGLWRLYGTGPAPTRVSRDRTLGGARPGCAPLASGPSPLVLRGARGGRHGGLARADRPVGRSGPRHDPGEHHPGTLCRGDRPMCRGDGGRDRRSDPGDVGRRAATTWRVGGRSGPAPCSERRSARSSPSASRRWRWSRWPARSPPTCP